MKTRMFTIAIATLMVGLFFTSCESAEQRANDDVREAQAELKEAKQDASFAAQKSADAEEWRVFKTDVDESIAKNKNRIAELKVQMEKPGQALDAAYAKRIEVLEEQNEDLRTRMVTYEKDQSDWESFKREFNRDLNELEKELHNFTVDNQN